MSLWKPRLMLLLSVVMLLGACYFFVKACVVYKHKKITNFNSKHFVEEFTNNSVRNEALANEMSRYLDSLIGEQLQVELRQKDEKMVKKINFHIYNKEITN